MASAPLPFSGVSDLSVSLCSVWRKWRGQALTACASEVPLLSTPQGSGSSQLLWVLRRVPRHCPPFSAHSQGPSLLQTCCGHCCWPCCGQVSGRLERGTKDCAQLTLISPQGPWHGMRNTGCRCQSRWRCRRVCASSCPADSPAPAQDPALFLATGFVQGSIQTAALQWPQITQVDQCRRRPGADSNSLGTCRTTTAP